jgi:hypothetical protein
MTVSLREEQNASLVLTRSLLHDLVMSNDVSDEFSGRAFKCITHFPPLSPVGEPIWAPHPVEGGSEDG